MTHGRRTVRARLTVDVRNVHVSRLTRHQHGRRSEHPKTDQIQTRHYLSAIGINFPTPSSTT